MPDEIDRDYFLRRAGEERARAAAAVDPAVATPHHVLAVEYERRGRMRAPRRVA